MPLSNFDLSLRFFLQLVLILAACQVGGWAFQKVGQPLVVSEVVAGVLLGPSLLGWLFPGAEAYLFPRASMPILFAVAQLALVLVMFLTRLRPDPTRRIEPAGGGASRRQLTADSQQWRPGSGGDWAARKLDPFFQKSLRSDG